MIIEINPHNPQTRLIKQVADLLRHDAVICYPTDTGYGIGCDIFNAKAIRQVELLKRRPPNKPFSFMCSDLKNISEFAHVSNTAYRLLKKNLPGPYTFVLPGTKLVPKVMTTKQKTVGIRVPENAICRALLAEFGAPIINTSLPLSDDVPPPTEAYEIDELIGNRVDLIIDGGPVYPDPSSVIDLTGDAPEILRAGKGDVTPFR
ncbi:L-threonylcarbamoyladenylate synthase [Desulfofustis limnaeus]|jgi:tRNA threonylcarbamoyl adenosine modification protein (Sua5/YciO/YrdC/YwlC family)|uniref:Threonylcarbamoyl-AMP synthase n=1 Tax=Desulfofustis limnaeus TaxID=2740163 RepID=A0ABN6M7Z6_9BACT|nr:L-threonylcarbamoyladenylate synthase [Desulfofustis limnaeus]MDX9894087.1 L-threonylcarbamoyladenylate synthase [Desulfofustis sp.]BDD88988.1 threonylcarbamoyl-AMP synthase [Desulfofustis limnaeus]